MAHTKSQHDIKNLFQSKKKEPSCTQNVFTKSFYCKHFRSVSIEQTLVLAKRCDGAFEWKVSVCSKTVEPTRNVRILLQVGTLMEQHYYLFSKIDVVDKLNERCDTTWFHTHDKRIKNDGQSERTSTFIISFWSHW